MVRKRGGYTHLDRRDYVVTLLSIPGMKGAALVRAAEFKLPEGYPGDMAACRWDYRRLRLQGREQLLIAVVPAEPAGKASLYIPLFHAVDLKLHRSEKGIILSESGITDILEISPGEGYRLRQHKGEHAGSITEALSGRRGYRGAFPLRRGNRTRVGLGLLFLLTLGALALWGMRVAASRQNALEELIARRHVRTSRMEELVTLQQRISALRSSETGQTSGITALCLLALLSETLPAGSELVRLEYSPERTTVEIIGPDALQALERLTILNEVKADLSGAIRPLTDGSNRERYLLVLETEP